MFSTIDNIRNPMRLVDGLHLHPAIDSWKCPTIQHITQGQYDLITHDPNTIYHITNSDKPKAYIGDLILKESSKKLNVLMGPEDEYGYYSIYKVLTDDCGDTIIEICKCANINDAINTLNGMSRTDTPFYIRGVIRQSILNYISGIINVNDFIIGLFSMFGYGDDPRLQDVIMVMNSWGAFGWKDEIPVFPAQQILAAATCGNFMFRLYADVYHDVIIANNYFRDKEYHKDPDTIDLTTPLNKIFNIFRHNDK